MNMIIGRRDVLALATGLAASPLAGSGLDPDNAERNFQTLSDVFLQMGQTGRATIASGVYKLLKPLVIPPGVLDGGDVVLDFRGAQPRDFPGGACVLVRGKDKTALPNLARDISVGARSFTFARPHGLSVGDVFQLSGTVDYAGNGYRAYYRKGEMFTVARVIDKNIVETSAGCRDSYEAAGVACWKRLASTFEQSCASLRVMAPDNIDYPIRFLGLDHSVVDNISADGGAVSAIDFTDCHDFSGRRIRAHQRSNIFDGYGISICHCQSFQLQGEVYGYFNGITTGGGPFGPPGMVGINRDIHFEGKGASDPAGGLAGAHFHGNTEYSSYRGVFVNGVTMAGNNNEAHGHFIGRSGQFAIQLGEMHGHSFHISGVVRTTGAELRPQIGAINMDDFGLHARYGGRAVIDVELHAPNASRLILWRTQNLLRKDVVLEFRRFDVVEAHPSNRFVILSRVSGKDFPLIEFGKWNIIDNRRPITWSINPGTKLRGMDSSRTVTVKNATQAIKRVIFDPAFPRTPKFMIAENSQSAGSAAVLASIVEASENGVVVKLAAAGPSKRNIDTKISVRGFFDD